MRQQGWKESDNRQGQGQGQGQRSTALRWIGADRAHKRDPVGSGKSGTLCKKEHGESTSADRQRSRSGQHPYTTGRQGRHASPVPKGGTAQTAGASTEEERATAGEKGGKRPLIKGTGSGKTGPEGAKVLLGPYRDAGRGRRIIFADENQKNFAFRYALDEKIKESTKEYMQMCYYCSMEINKSGACYGSRWEEIIGKQVVRSEV